MQQKLYSVLNYHDDALSHLEMFTKQIRLVFVIMNMKGEYHKHKFRLKAPTPKHSNHPASLFSVFGTVTEPVCEDS